ncbi:hypothetical protein LCGC14_1200550 [marine sediment metagenome]|uniref:pantoate--beta-alanine ligase (AMP-forming) n=1 Tax=marine sediment metagenome TaxID=412755 RepID=A0A0F9NZE7_9ZZZZ
MQVISTIKEIKNKLLKERSAGRTIGFVPTMGAFHKGHIALMEKAKKENDVVVVSLFVNPTQFGDGEDYEDYSRDQKRDSEIAEQFGVHYLFAPEESELYGSDFDTYVQVGSLGEVLCGKKRTSHFKGVATIVTKLFNIVGPDTAYFGKKDYQQLRVIEKMVQDLNMQVIVQAVETVRDEDGLALSSRNTYLSYDEREQAMVLYQALSKVKEMVQDGNDSTAELEDAVCKMMDKRPLVQLEYIHIVDRSTLKAIKKIEDGKSLAAIAANVGKARLIDNIEL